MIISGKVFLEGCIMAPFRLIGLAKHAYPLGDQRLDKNFELLVKRKYKNIALEELKLIMKTKNQISKEKISLNGEFNRIMNIWKALNSDLTQKVKFEDNEWKYPGEWKIFISKISQPQWMDENYSQKPVQKWIEKQWHPHTMNTDELKAFFTYIIRQERFTEGFQKFFMEKYFNKHKIY